ncbi:fibronectin type III domain-containing protein [Desulfosporosinus sp. PR]|uniref:fibronectin type III domain-containing protein n=1 Tax=Candidatus Desulfosporosinus nitrosoreducens TaxID=3401928 RepID=UPI0027F7F8AC|nr:fibronectin type III domain-containing protein [Desulfosporosinus sp. PR]MDQ7094217.1 fibronectin type III domain-containing protein [Desulfosporosinus sp. PR]
MSTVPQDLSIYGITENSAFLQWFSTGADTNYADILCYATDNLSTPVFSNQNIYTPNTQYYSSQITGLKPSKTYVAFIHTKLDQQGTGESALSKSPQFTTLADTTGDPNVSPIAQQLVYVKTNIAGYFFDAVLQTNYTRSLTITDHPVETGAAITDHAYVNPVELVMQIGMSDVATSIVPGQFSQGSSRSLTAFQVLTKLQEQRIPMNVMTHLGLFKNMLISEIAVPDDYTTLYGLKATVTLREVFVASVKTVKVSANPHVTDSTNRGVVVPQTPNKSVVKSIKDKLENAPLGTLQNA